MMRTGLRLNKALARAGVCSRRGADLLIFAGRVKVNDQVVLEPGTRVDPDKDRLQVEGRPVDLREAQKQEPVYVLVNKPVHMVTTLHDPQGRSRITDLLPQHLEKIRLFPVGRLDYFSQGLLLLTNDGDLAYRLMHPSGKLPKVYRVRLRGDLSKEKIRAMRQGMVLREGRRLAPAGVQVRERKGDLAVVDLTLVQGINRQIRRMCRDLDLTVLSLTRVRQGPLVLGDMPPGQWRLLTPREIQALKQSVGL